MRSSARLVSALAAASCFLAVPMSAQYRQYTAPGALGETPEQTREALERAVDEAPWKLGPVRIAPVLGLSDLAYVDDGETAPGGDEGGDFTATATAGLRGYLPIGSRNTLVMFAVPDYVWWMDQDELRRLNQRFGVGLFTFFNRLGIEVKAQRMEDLDYVTNQVARRTASRSDAFSADLEIPIGSRISVVGGGAVTTSTNNLDDVAGDGILEQLDREDRLYRVGLAWYLSETLSVSARWGQTATTFEDEAENRDNSGDVWSVGLDWNRPKLGVNLSFDQSKLEPEEGSTFEGFEGETWAGSIRWSPRERFSLSIYGQNQLSYAILSASSIYADERYGARVGFGLGWRLSLDFFAEQGTLDYGVGEGAVTPRVDDLEAYGVRLSAPLGRRFTIAAGARWTTVDSEVPGAGYELTEILGTVGLGLGSGTGTWY